jgi:hypothetical protein
VSTSEVIVGGVLRALPQVASSIRTRRPAKAHAWDLSSILIFVVFLLRLGLIVELKVVIGSVIRIVICRVLFLITIVLLLICVMYTIGPIGSALLFLFNAIIVLIWATMSSGSMRCGIIILVRFGVELCLRAFIIISTAIFLFGVWSLMMVTSPPRINVRAIVAVIIRFVVLPVPLVFPFFPWYVLHEICRVIIHVFFVLIAAIPVIPATVPLAGAARAAWASVLICGIVTFTAAMAIIIGQVGVLSIISAEGIALFNARAAS